MDESSAVSKAGFAEGFEVPSETSSSTRRFADDGGRAEHISSSSFDLPGTPPSHVRSTVQQKFRQMSEDHDRIRSQKLLLRLGRTG